MVLALIIFIVSLYLVIHGSAMATRYSARLARRFGLTEYTVGFIIVAIISILPETFISINAAIAGIPSFGLGLLFGSDIADLTLVFALIILISGRNLKIQSSVMRNGALYPFLLLLPILLGLDGHFSRIEGLVLVIAGAAFYYFALREGKTERTLPKSQHSHIKSFFMLVLAMALLLVGSHFTVTSATTLASLFGISPIILGMFVVGLGTTMPELFFSLKSAEKHEDSLAVGDILGTVLADATVVVGIIALITPYSFPIKIIYITGGFLILAALILFIFMRTGRSLSKKEAFLLLLVWAIFAVVEILHGVS
jgi:cation:H+ antiporter